MRFLSTNVWGNVGVCVFEVTISSQMKGENNGKQTVRKDEKAI